MKKYYYIFLMGLLIAFVFPQVANATSNEQFTPRISAYQNSTYPTFPQVIPTSTLGRTHYIIVWHGVRQKYVLVYLEVPYDKMEDDPNAGTDWLYRENSIFRSQDLQSYTKEYWEYDQTTGWNQFSITTASSTYGGGTIQWEAIFASTYNIYRDSNLWYPANPFSVGPQSSDYTTVPYQGYGYRTVVKHSNGSYLLFLTGFVETKNPPDKPILSSSTTVQAYQGYKKYHYSGSGWIQDTDGDTDSSPSFVNINQILYTNYDLYNGSTLVHSSDVIYDDYTPDEYINITSPLHEITSTNSRIHKFTMNYSIAVTQGTQLNDVQIYWTWGDNSFTASPYVLQALKVENESSKILFNNNVYGVDTYYVKFSNTFNGQVNLKANIKNLINNKTYSDLKTINITAFVDSNADGIDDVTGQTYSQYISSVNTTVEESDVWKDFDITKPSTWSTPLVNTFNNLKTSYLALNTSITSFLSFMPISWINLILFAMSLGLALRLLGR